MVRAFLLVVCFLCNTVAAANNDDGFVWVDANTKIRLKPIGKAGDAAAGDTKGPEPKKGEKKEKPKK
jgi:hypothetical protein